METSSPSYSFFWPLQILVTCLCLWLGYHVFLLNETRTLAEAGLKQVQPQTEASLLEKKRLLDLAQDLLQVAPKSPAAAQIVKEFDIHVIAPEKLAP